MRLNECLNFSPFDENRNLCIRHECGIEQCFVIARPKSIAVPAASTQKSLAITRKALSVFKLRESKTATDRVVEHGGKCV